MKLDKFLQLFVVKEKTFFPLFIQTTENIVKAAHLLVDLTREADPVNRQMLANRIKECETTGDTFTDHIIEKLIDAYNTPFDREDIHQLAQDLDTFLDGIRDAAKKFAIYQPVGNDEKLTEMALMILRDAELMDEITKKFENMRKDIDVIGRLCDAIQETEHSADDIFTAYMSDLFKGNVDFIELVKKKNIIQTLEETCDDGKDVSETIRTILVKLG